MKILAKKILDAVLTPLGVELRRKNLHTTSSQFNQTPDYQDYRVRFLNMLHLGFSPKYIYDCGAFKGYWTKDIAKIFNQAHFFLFEPNPELHTYIETNLSEMKDRYELFKFAVGDSPSTFHLNIWGDDTHETNLAGASLLEHVIGAPSRQIEVEVVTLNNFITNHPIPDLIKMDLQGAEIMALRGASELLKTTEVLMIEFGLIEAYENRTTVKDLIDLAHDYNFVLYDIIGLSYRPLDQALGGGDFIFVQKDSPLRKNKLWK